VPDHRHGRRIDRLDVGQPASQPGEHVLRRAHIEVDPGHVRAVADALEPSVHDRQRPIAGQESRHQQDCAAVSMPHAAAPEDRVSKQRAELAHSQRIGDLHRQGW